MNILKTTKKSCCWWCVRDFIMGIEPKDYDLVTNALPEESIKILKKFNVSDEQGKSFGVIRVFTKR